MAGIALSACTTQTDVTHSNNNETILDGTWFGSQPIQQKHPIILEGFHPGSKHKDPYTGHIYTANQDGEIIVP